MGVVDGDTIDVLTADNHQLRIRLAEIDAPEHNQPWGQRAKQTLSGMVFGRTVQVTPVSHDRYGRTVARLSVGGRDVNREMVVAGAAWAYRPYLTEQSLLTAEAQARSARVGLWSMSTSETMPPWEWRHGGSQAAPVTKRSQPPATDAATPSHSAQCGAKQYCREMSSCREAKTYLQQCGLTRLDGDGDGVPCESLCRAH